MDLALVLLLVLIGTGAIVFAGMRPANARPSVSEPDHPGIAPETDVGDAAAD